MNLILKSSCSARFILFGLFIVGCTSGSESVVQSIDIDIHEAKIVSLSEIADSISYVSLETSDSSLIGSISQIEESDEFFFILDTSNDRVLQFSSEGVFIRQVGRFGLGPGEYNAPRSIALDENQKIVYIASQNKIIGYNFGGSVALELTNLNRPESVSIIDGQICYIAQARNISNLKSPDISYNVSYLYRLDKNGMITDSTMVMKSVFRGVSATPPSTISFLSILNSATYVYYPVLTEQDPIIRDTLYRVTREGRVPSVKLNFGLEENDGSFLIWSINRTEDYLIVDYWNNKKNRIFYYRFSDGMTLQTDTGFNDDFYMTGTTKLSILDTENDFCYFVKDAFDIQNKIQDIKENSNPVIFKVKLKTSSN